MEAIILCAGYATRLYPLTLDRPKPLLPVRGKPLLDYIIENLERTDFVNNIYIVTNDKFYNNFVEWRKNLSVSKKIDIINDKTKNNDDRLDGLGDLLFALVEKKIDDDLLVILGDNFFDLDFNEFVSFFRQKNSFVVGLYELSSFEECKKFGILEIGSDGRVISFEEKPEFPKSKFVSTGIYLFPRKSLGKISDYMKTNLPKDGPGYLIDYFLRDSNVYGYVLKDKWYDIGDIETYNKINK